MVRNPDRVKIPTGQNPDKSNYLLIILKYIVYFYFYYIYIRFKLIYCLPINLKFYCTFVVDDLKFILINTLFYVLYTLFIYFVK